MEQTTPLNPTIKKYIDFYNNKFIHSIAFNERWTISTKEKIPVDMKKIKYDGIVVGAKYTDERCLMSLPELLSEIPEAANHAYYLDAIVDNFVVLDIEPTCPDYIKHKLLELPYIYGEKSMSGKGYHLVFPLPSSIEDFKAAQTKPALKDDNGYYEILMNHYVTFTRDMIPPSHGIGNFNSLFNELASKQKLTNRKDFSLDKTATINNIPSSDSILYVLGKNKPKKEISDYGNDASRWEFAYGRSLVAKLEQILNVKMLKSHNFTNDEKALLIYKTLKENLPPRDKHDTERQGLPWLLYIAQEVIAKADYNKED